MTKSIVYRPNRYKKKIANKNDLNIQNEDCEYGLCFSPSDWYQRAQIAFQRSVLQMPIDLVRIQRQNEWNTLEQFWIENTKPLSISKKTIPSTENDIVSSYPGKSIYISGPPGTGKSAMVSAFIESQKPFPEYLYLIHVNCMTLKEPKKLQKHLIDQWFESNKKKERKKTLVTEDDIIQSDSNHSRQLQLQKWESLRSLFFTSSNTYVLVLDEMDQLIQHGSNIPLFASTSSNHSNTTCDQQPSFLYHLFELSQLPNSRLVLVGIANAMDLMHHWIPKFNARQLNSPKQCHFAPFTIEQTMLMLKHRIRVSMSNAGKFHDPCIKHHQGFHPVALELCSRKVASMGDFRKALDLCRLTVERAEKDYFDNLLSKNSEQFVPSNHAKENEIDNYNDIKPSSLIHLVGFQHVQQAISLIFGSPLMQTMADLNLHHQLVLISIYVISKHKKQESVFPLVLQKYNQLCQLKHIQLVPLTRSEFHDSLTLLEGKGLILMKRGSSMVSSSIVSMKRKKSGSFGGGEGMMVKHMETRMALKCHEEDLLKGLAHVPMLISLIEEEREKVNK